jgi:hypothetical protein
MHFELLKTSVFPIDCRFPFKGLFHSLTSKKEEYEIRKKKKTLKNWCPYTAIIIMNALAITSLINFIDLYISAMGTSESHT